MNGDMLIDDLAIHIKASKSRDYQNSARLRFKTFISFLEKHDLLSKESKLSSEQFSDDVKVMKSDLTENGWILVCKVYEKWLSSVDRKQNPSDASVLEKELKKIL